MPMRPATFRPRGVAPKAERVREYEQRRGSAAARGYDADWRRAARAHLTASPLCRYCEVGAWGAPRVTAATLVDHFYQHMGDMTLFWASDWWVSSCKPCHDGPKQAVERIGGSALDLLALRLGLVVRRGGG